MRLCTITGCQKIHYGKGYCQMHYLRSYRNGDPNIKKPSGKNCHLLTLKERFEDKFIKGDKKECWLWQASISNGYGNLTYKNKSYIASRVSYQLYIGEIKSNMFVCHKCDNPLCVNPNHLFLGSPTDNVKDMMSKQRSAKGEDHSQAKLINSDVVKIKEMLKKQNFTDQTIADLFNVKRETINRIKLNKAWKHIT